MPLPRLRCFVLQDIDYEVIVVATSHRHRHAVTAVKCEPQTAMPVRLSRHASVRQIDELPPVATTDEELTEPHHDPLRDVAVAVTGVALAAALGTIVLSATALAFFAPRHAWFGQVNDRQWLQTGGWVRKEAGNVGGIGACADVLLRWEADADVTI
jgi:hypothetical protein